MTKAASIALALSFATLVLAQGALTGRWQGETRNGSDVVLELTATDTTLRGTLTRNGESSAISDGKVSENTFTFTVTLGGQAEAVTGELSGDQMKVWLNRNPQSSALLTRFK